MVDAPILEPDKIEILEFTILKGLLENPEGFDSGRVRRHNFAVDLAIGFNLEESLIKSTIHLEVQTDSNSSHIQEAKSAFEISFLFHYPDLESFIVLSESGGSALHQHLGNAIASITYSTSRGILITRYQGTPFENFFLPVVDPNFLLKP